MTDLVAVYISPIVAFTPKEWKESNVFWFRESLIFFSEISFERTQNTVNKTEKRGPAIIVTI